MKRLLSILALALGASFFTSCSNINGVSTKTDSYNSFKARSDYKSTKSPSGR
jgi:hypothetical protein